MAEPAIQEEGQVPGNVVSLPGAEPGVTLQRKTEGGLSLHFAFDIPKLPKVRTVGSWTHQQMINGALLVAVVLLAGFTVYDKKFSASAAPAGPKESTTGLIRPNVLTQFNPTVDTPKIEAGAYIDKLASVIGDVSIGAQVFVAPFASIRGDEGQPIVIGEGTNVQDGVVVHALETFSNGRMVEANLVTVDGKKYAVYVGAHVSLAHQSQVHGPAAVGDHTFIGMQALIFKSVIGKNVVVEPGAKVIGVTVAEGRYVPAGSIVVTQEAADALPKITPAYAFAKLNDGVLEVNEAFADKYLELATGGAAAPAGH
jgi:carbonic anhydrase/acetyltransferase-like protein (isoleucine patch superfamily)